MRELAVQTEPGEYLPQQHAARSLSSAVQTEPEFPWPLCKFVDEFRDHETQMRLAYAHAEHGPPQATRIPFQVSLCVVDIMWLYKNFLC
jgi:hypothetical protein